MSESQINLSKPPRSPPMDIPRKERTVYNSFFPEPSRKNVITKLDIVKNNKIKFNLLKEELNRFKEELHVFIELKKGEKIGKEGICENNKIKKEEEQEEQDEQEEQNEQDEQEEQQEETIKCQKKYYKQTPYMGMWISRWWYSESREKTVDYLDEDFTKFMNYLDRILFNLNCDPTGIYINLVNELRDFINDIIPGLYNLKQTYPETVKVVAKVDSIILTLLDFKEKTDEYLARKSQNVKLTVKSKKIPISQKVSVYAELPPNSV